jgi:MarR family transcriptional regulator for hemolysin
MSARIDTDAIGFLIADVARLLRVEFDRRTANAGMGLTPGEARALVNAARAGPVRQAILAERMSVEAMTLSTYLDRLEGRGLVRRVPDPDDRRAKLVHTTDEALPVLEEINRVGKDLRHDLSATLDPALFEEIRQGLKVMRQTLLEMRPECSKANTQS